MAKRRIPRGARAVAPGRVAIEQSEARQAARKERAQTAPSGPVRVRRLLVCSACTWTEIVAPDKSALAKEAN